MRSGVIAQKVGMTRVFTDAGEHVPVTVLKLDGCQVVAHRTKEQERLYGVAARHRPRQGQERAPRRSAARFAVAKVEPKMKLAEFRVAEDRLHAGRRGNHRRPFRRRPVRRRDGHDHRQGLRRADEALELRRPARHPRRVGLASFARFDRRPSGSGQDLQEQEDGRPYGRRSGDDAESARRADRRRARPDSGRRRGARSRRRLDLSARRREEAAAERGAAARQIPCSRGAAGRAPPAEPKGA